MQLEVWARRSELVAASGAQLESLVREAAMAALRENVAAVEVCMRHVDQACARVCAPW